MITFGHLESLATLAPSYRRLRGEHPAARAKDVVAYLKSDGCDTFEEFTCPGHRWIYTGSSYGGDDESYHGEGRAYCQFCGKDGDA